MRSPGFEPGIASLEGLCPNQLDDDRSNLLSDEKPLLLRFRSYSFWPIVSMLSVLFRVRLFCTYSGIACYSNLSFLIVGSGSGIASYSAVSKLF